MFGDKDDLEISFTDSILIKLIRRQYEKSSVTYRMFFDKRYRPERYQCMTEQISKHKNINEFRTYVLHNHYRFPKSCVTMLRGKPESAGLILEQSDESGAYANILLESQLLKYYNRVYLSEQMLYPWMIVTIGFVAKQIITRKLDYGKVFNFCVAPGILLSGCNLYARNYGNSEREKQLTEKYEV